MLHLRYLTGAVKITKYGATSRTSTQTSDSVSEQYEQVVRLYISDLQYHA